MRPYRADYLEHVNSKITITYDIFLQGLADVKAYIKGESNNTWVSAELTSSQNVRNSWVEVHTVTNFNEDSVRVKLVLKGNTLYRPRVQALKVVIV